MLRRRYLLVVLVVVLIHGNGIPHVCAQRSRSTFIGDFERIRPWTDKAARRRIIAAFKGMDGDDVVLERMDGSRIAVPLKNLSARDQERIATLVSKNISGENQPKFLKAKISKARVIHPSDVHAMGIQSNISIGTVATE